MKVKFENVGRFNKTWEAECKGDLTGDWLYYQVAPNCASRDIDFYLDKEDKTKGIIVAGFGHKIGTFIVEE